MNEVQSALIELVKKGHAFASTKKCIKCECDEVTFVHHKYADDEDKEFSKEWIKAPFFQWEETH